MAPIISSTMTESNDSSTIALEPFAAMQSDGDPQRAPQGEKPSVETTPLAASVEPPDGGWQAWINVACGATISFVTFGFILAFGELEAHYLQDQLSNYTKPDVAWIASIQIWALLVLSMLSGRWFDAHGLRLLLFGGWTSVTVALIGVAFSREYYQFFLAHLLYGIGCSMVFVPAVSSVGQWFAKKRATAMGIVLAGTGLGGIIYPIMISRLLQRISFRNTILAVMGLTSGLLLPCAILMKTRLPTRKLPPWRDLAKPWKDSRFTIVFIGSTIIGFNLFSPFFDIPVYAASNSSNMTIITYSITFAQIGAFIGRLSGGFLADAFGIWPVFLITGSGCGIALLALWVGPVGSGGVVVGLLLFGALQGAWITLITGVVASLGPREELGLRIGIFLTGWAFPSFLGPFFAGLIIDAPGSQGRYTYAGVFAGLTWLLGVSLTSVPKVTEFLRSRRISADTQA